MAPVEWLIGRMLESACARARAESPRAAGLLATLAGKRLAIRVLGTPWAERPLRLACDGAHLELLTATEAARPDDASAAAQGASDATVSGAPWSLLSLAGADPEAIIRRGDVRIEGDALVAQHYRELAPLLVPDLEQSLARLVGRSAAHVAARGVRGATDAVRGAAWTSAQNLAEFLAHESGDLVSHHEAEHFLRGTEELRERLDRVDAQLSDLEQRATTLGDTAGCD
jgi:ubiquinone biosynthesis accessory factor UbiJ